MSSPVRSARLPLAGASLATALARDTRGAIALLGLFMAVLLTAFAYYLIGIGEAVLYRERMQDAADVAAFSAAVLHARGMNLIALVNMTMAALLAVLVALKLLETVISIALVIITVSSFFAPGLASAIPPLVQLRSQVQSAHEELRPPIHSMLETLHAAGVAVRDVVPAASVLRGAEIAGAQPGSPLETALVVPPRLTLPTEDGTFAELCAHAGGYVGDTAGLALGAMPPEIAGDIAAVIEDLASSRADWFCGAEDAVPPSAERTHTLRYPYLPRRQQCERMTPDADDYDAYQHEAVCAQAERDEQASEPEEHRGHCEHGCDRELYEQRAALARRDCAPRAGVDGLRDFHWQQRRFRRSYAFSRGTWHVTSSHRVEEDSARYRVRREDRRPCGPEHAQTDGAWNLEPKGRDGRSQPLCSDARPPAHSSAREGQTRTLDHIEVTHIFGCAEDVKRTYDLGEEHRNDRISGGDDADKTPQVLGADVELGEEPFQVRAIALGSALPTLSARVIEVARWRKPSGDEQDWIATAAAQLGRVAVAQAEYFYAVEHPAAPERSSFLWNMRWQARLRRFRLPDASASEGDDASSVFAALLTACDGVFNATSDVESPCAQLEGELTRIVH